MEEKIKILSDNRSAGHNYSLSDRTEAGLVLRGTEVKAAKDGKIQLKDAYGEVSGNEAWLCNAHIGQYSTKLYLKHGLIKVELAIGKGKKLHDKRESEREREMKDEARAGMARKRKE